MPAGAIDTGRVVAFAFGLVPALGERGVERGGVVLVPVVAAGGELAGAEAVKVRLKELEIRSTDPRWRHCRQIIVDGIECEV